jgi:hypothetical protein
MGEWVMIPIPLFSIWFTNKTSSLHGGVLHGCLCPLCTLSHRTKISIMGPKNSSVLLLFLQQMTNFYIHAHSVWNTASSSQHSGFTCYIAATYKSSTDSNKELGGDECLDFQN